MAKVVQITMSRINNYGSILQTYAMQRAIENIPGWTCETIDYLPQGGSSGARLPLFKRLLNCVRREVIYGRQNRGFRQMRVEEIRMTRPYANFEDLREAYPEANVYLTGSDQTFNPLYTKGDPAYFLSFISEKRRESVRKISYSASFAQRLEEEWRPIYRQALMDYDALSIREQHGVDLAHELTGKEVAHCCDPTLLLTHDEWAEFAQKARKKIRVPYILCYNLAYRVNPYPMANRVEKAVQNQLELPLIFLNGSKSDCLKPHSRIIKGATPYEFVDLFFNATFIMTSSFHGAAFALQSGKPFLAYVHGNADADNRTFDLLRRCGAASHAMPIGPSFTSGLDLKQFESSGREKDRLNDFRHKSNVWLRKNLEEALIS